MQGALNTAIDILTQKNDTLEAVVEAMKKQMEELMGELSSCKTAIGGSVLAVTSKHRIEIPKPKEFKGTRSAKDLDNFLWGMEQYFRAMGIEDDATKVNTGSMYFTDVALLWWHRRCNNEKRGGTTIGTWEVFQTEFRQQFHPEYAEDEARAKL